MWMLSPTRPLLTLTDGRFWLWRAIPDRGSEDCRHVDHGHVVDGIQDANMEGRCQEADELDGGKGQFDSKSVGMEVFFFFDSPSHLGQIGSLPNVAQRAFVFRRWRQENELFFVSHDVTFTACFFKTINLTLTGITVSKRLSFCIIFLS